MSVENESAIELSGEELDLVNGGAITDKETGSYRLTDNALLSGFSVGAGGTTSVNQATNLKIVSLGAKQVTIS